MSASPAVVVPQDGENQLTNWSKSSELCDNLPSLSKLEKETLRLGDDNKTKVRKPYTITKQRERWTEEEHERFLEALKLYGRAWRQIEEHVGTKTAVQIRSHAQKFFSKLEREGSSGSSKGLISEIDIPPPRPKRKPAHPYPRKGISLSSYSTRRQLRSPQTSARKSSGCDVSLQIDDAIMEANKSPLSSTPETNDQHPLCTVSEKILSPGFCQQPHKQGTEEVESDSFRNESQETTKLSRTTCAESELNSAQKVAANQPNSSMPCHNNILPFGMYGPHMALPYFHPMHSLAAFPNAALLLNTVLKSTCQSQKQEDAPDLASLAAAHAQLGNSLMPWLNQNPIAIAAATATTPWTGLGPPPQPPLHLPLRPPLDGLNAESPSALAAAITAAAAASFADMSAWIAFHRAYKHPPNAPEVRSLFKPNPVVHSDIAEDQQQQGLTNSSEGSKNGVTVNGQTSSEEHDASTAAGMQETTPYPIADNHSLPSGGHSQSNLCRYEEETSKNQENKGHSSTDNSCNVKKEKRRNGFSSVSGNGLLVQSTNGLQKSTYITMNGKMLERLRTADMNSDQVEFSPSMYQGNSPKSGKSVKENKGNGEGCAYKGSLDREECAYKEKINGSLDAFTTSVHVIDCTVEEQSGSSAGKNKDCVASESITNTANMEIQVPRPRECISSCGSTEDDKDKENNGHMKSSKTPNEGVQECGASRYIDDSGSEIIPCEKGGKFLVQTCLKRWQGGKIMLTHTRTNEKSASKAVCGDPMDDDSESMDISLINGNKQGVSLIKADNLKGLKASRSGSSKYSGHGFVPYRRD
ncbi:hypothetical protein GOP47_0000733 [Adiantum capillus-veneris]|nr:hypothetical protein GOP47_0000733 [Adiantum capillus-veneris]